jgi:IMP dehydrogenase
MHELGGLGIIHHYLSIEKHVTALQSYSGPKVACIGVSENEFQRAIELTQKGLAQTILVDTAHADSDAAFEMIFLCQGLGTPTRPISIIAGNVVTYEAALCLFRMGVHSVKVGCGSGSLCLTRTKTGNGFPQLSAIIEVAAARDAYSAQYHKDQWRPTIIADGGIRQPGDCVKALAAGADAVMIGNLFAGTKESLGVLAHHPTKNYCTYRGMASLSFKQDRGCGLTRGVEGDVMSMARKGSAVGVFTELVDGILSGMSYQDAHTIAQLQRNAVFYVQTLAGIVEGTAHGLNHQV